ncbi:MAG: squalene synthase HpnC, partial [Ignavibacteria bacterium]|nr:squalene synthase HpnC [Ignavibacteria bacterium]
RLILELYNVRDDKAFYYSDKICTALQLTNFYQDVSKDILKNRI